MTQGKPVAGKKLTLEEEKSQNEENSLAGCYY
jgi:hypothetical protein